MSPISCHTFLNVCRVWVSPEWKSLFAVKLCTFKVIKTISAPSSTKVHSNLLFSVTYLPESRKIFRETLIPLAQGLLSIFKFSDYFVLAWWTDRREMFYALFMLCMDGSVRYIRLKMTIRKIFSFRYIKKFYSSSSEDRYLGFVAYFLLIALHWELGCSEKQPNAMWKLCIRILYWNCAPILWTVLKPLITLTKFVVHLLYILSERPHLLVLIKAQTQDPGKLDLIQNVCVYKRQLQPLCLCFIKLSDWFHILDISLV